MNNKAALNLLVILSAIALSFAYFVEFILGHEPCNLCKIERMPYIGTIIFGSLLIFINKWEKIILLLILFLFLFGSVVSVYHVGIEQDIFSESLLCELGINTNILTTEELLKDLAKAPISCKDVTFTMFGLSLATFNIILSTVFSVIFAKLFLNYGKN